MINKNMIKKFNKIATIINDYDFFNFYTFDEFMNFHYENYNKNDEYYNEMIENVNKFKNEYNCNNENTIVLMYNCDDDEYLTINFENETLIISQNDCIEHVNDDVTQNALYEILYNLFCECETY